MAEYDPERLLRVLERHEVTYVVIGGIAAQRAGAPLLTEDLDITPERLPDNLERLAAALRAMDARLRGPGEPDGIPFPVDAAMLATSDSWTLVTRFGPLDVVFAPAGTQGFPDLSRDAQSMSVGRGLVVTVASLRDVIRMKGASGRAKDERSLPLLRLTLEETNRRERG